MTTEGHALELQTNNAAIAVIPTEVIPFPKKEPTDTCNGKIHRQERYCRKPAGWGTDHPGSGRCKLHGGCCTGPKSGQLRYSDYVPMDLVERYEELSVEPDIKSLDSEIALVRSKVTRLEELNNDGRFDKLICNMVELIRRLAETKQRCEDGIKSRVTIDVAIKIVDSVIQVIDKNIEDVSLKKKIAGELRRLNTVELGLDNLN